MYLSHQSTGQLSWTELYQILLSSLSEKTEITAYETLFNILEKEQTAATK